MIAIDAGYFIALADLRDRWHERAVACLPTQGEGWITTWPVLTEACHIIATRLSPDIAVALMQDAAEGSLLIWTPPPERIARIPELMRKYAKLPMDLADASLVLLAEYLGHGRILSTDLRDFEAYRWKNHKPFVNLLEAPP